MRAFSTRRTLFNRPVIAVLLVVTLPLVAMAFKEWKSGIVWPEPPVVTPGENGSAPSDAIVLFDGSGVDQWNGGEKWLSDDGVLTATKRKISTKQKFGSCQLHVEFMSPEKVEGKGQGRGNSGIFFGNFIYEVQVLDSFENETYFDGQCGAIYKQSPPIVNPCRKPGQWQTYDIIYSAPEFGEDDKLIKPAYLTVLLNGVLIQNHYELKGKTLFTTPPSYTAHQPKQPIGLQFHRNPVKFRNIWVRENVAAHQPQLPKDAHIRRRKGDVSESKQK